MSLNHPIAGYGSVGEFQSSAIPWCSSSNIPSGQTARHDFHHITRFITVRNQSGSGSAVRVAFTQNGAEANNSANYFRVEGGQSETFEVRVAQLFLRPHGSFAVSVDVIAGLTTVLSSQMSPLTGSAWTGVG